MGERLEEVPGVWGVPVLAGVACFGACARAPPLLGDQVGQHTVAAP